MKQLTKVKDLKEGDLIDLEGDIYADPKHDRLEFQCLACFVETVEPETPDCVAVWIEGLDCFGFPPDHRVWKIVGE